MRNEFQVVDISVPDGSGKNDILWIPPRLHETDGISFGTSFSQIIESPSGYSQRTRYSPQQRKTVQYTWDCVDLDDREFILNHFQNSAQGKKNPFWMPLWTNWFDLPLGVVQGSYSVAIRPTGFNAVFPDWYYDRIGFAPESIMIVTKNGNIYARPIVACPTSNQLILEYPFADTLTKDDIRMATRILQWNYSSGISERMVSSIEGNLDVFELSASFLQLSNNEEGKGIFPYLDGVSGAARKYVLTGDTMDFYGVTLNRIRALRYLDGVSPGDLGGWIESEDNLSHKGNCWVYDESVVLEGAVISGHAKIKNNSIIADNVLISGRVLVDDSYVFDESEIWDNASILNGSMVFNSSIWNDATITGDCVIEQSQICGGVLISLSSSTLRAMIEGEAYVHDNCSIGDYAWIGGKAQILQNSNVFDLARVDGNAIVQLNCSVYGTFSPYY